MSAVEQVARGTRPDPRALFLLLQEIREHVDLPVHYFRGSAIASREKLHALLFQLESHPNRPGPEMVIWLREQGLTPRRRYSVGSNDTAAPGGDDHGS